MREADESVDREIYPIPVATSGSVRAQRRLSAQHEVEPFGPFAGVDLVRSAVEEYIDWHLTKGGITDVRQTDAKSGAGAGRCWGDDRGLQ